VEVERSSAGREETQKGEVCMKGEEGCMKGTWTGRTMGHMKAR
jgi:hypothetical protein